MAEPGMPQRAAPSARALWWGQVRYANRDFWRTPVAAFFTLALPLMYFVIISAIVGNEVLDDRSGIRLAQFLAPVFAVFGVVMATFAGLAIAVAAARDALVLKRLRGTPLPPAMYLLGRISSGVWIGLIAVVLVIGVGVVVYDVQIVWESMPGALVTLVVGVACFSALGLAVVALSPTAATAQAAGLGLIIPLAFISDMFTFASLPSWLDRVGWFLPLRHFVNAMADAFNPYLSGPGLYADHLLVMAAWGIAATLVTLRWFRWEPGPRHRKATAKAGSAAAAAPADVATSTGAARPRSVAQLALGQVRHATIASMRERMNLFWALIFPLALVVFFSLLNSGAQYRSVPLAQFLVPAFAVYGIAVAGYVNMPEGVALARDRGVLKRLRGTPVPSWAYLVGKVGASVLTALLIMSTMYAVGVVFLDVQISAADVPALLLVTVLTAAVFTALGLALVAVTREARTTSAVALGTLLPLAFISEIFFIGASLPSVVTAIGDAMPLKPLALAAFAATDPSGVSGGLPWDRLAVAVLWGVAAGLVAWRFFRWEPAVGKARPAEAEAEASADAEAETAAGRGRV